MSLRNVSRDVSREIIPIIKFSQVYDLREQEPQLYQQEIQQRSLDLDPYLVGIANQDIDLINTLLANVVSIDEFHFTLEDLFHTAIQADAYEIAHRLLYIAFSDDGLHDRMARTIDNDERLVLNLSSLSIVHGSHDLQEMAYSSKYAQEHNILPLIFHKYGVAGFMGVEESVEEPI